MSILETFLSRLQDVRPSGPGKWECRCPAHDDRAASLSVCFGETQEIVCHCHAGCETADVFHAVDMDWKDVLASKSERPTPIPQRIVATYDYRDESGTLLFQVVRMAPQKTFRQRMPDPANPGKWLHSVKNARKVPFRLPELLSDTSKPIYICEGEKDVLSLVALGCVATCNPGGAGKWLDAWGPFFKDRTVYILPDNDEPGRKHADDVSQKLSGYAASIQKLPVPAPHKDVTDFIHAGGSIQALHAPPAPPAIDPKAARDSYNPAKDTHLGNAERLISVANGNLRFCDELGGWHIWTGTHWQRSELAARRFVLDHVIPTIYVEAAEAARQHNSELSRNLAKWARRSESTGVIDGTLECAAAILSTAPDQWDKNEWLVNCKNGTLDIRTGVLHPHRQDDLITRVLPVAYDPQAKCPTWERFLNDAFLGRTGLIEWIQRAVGYSITGDVSEQCAFLLFGGGCNGKSTFNDTIAWVLGPYARETNADTLMATDRQSGINNDVVRLRGARFVSANETEGGQRLAESKFKGLTGGDTLCARYLHREFIEFRPTFKIWIRSNHLPRITGTDQGIWRRIRLVPFEANFEQNKDPKMGARLLAEAEGILAWIVRGAIAWRNTNLNLPPEVAEATKAYREGQDVLGQFLKEHIVSWKFEKVTHTKLYERYQKWCQESGERPISSRRMVTELTERGWSIKKCAPDWTRYWLDIDWIENHPVDEVSF